MRTIQYNTININKEKMKISIFEPITKQSHRVLIRIVEFFGTALKCIFVLLKGILD